MIIRTIGVDIGGNRLSLNDLILRLPFLQPYVTVLHAQRGTNAFGVRRKVGLREITVFIVCVMVRPRCWKFGFRCQRSYMTCFGAFLIRLGLLILEPLLVCLLTCTFVSLGYLATVLLLESRGILCIPSSCGQARNSDCILHAKQT